MSRLSHELRTPLTAIRGFAQLLSGSDALPAEDAESVGLILQASNHIISLLDNADEIVWEDRTIDIDLEAVDIGALAEEVRALMSPIAAERAVILDQRIAPGTYALANRRRLSQVLINLISNAIKYNHPGGDVRIDQQTAERGAIRVVVADNGPGIAESLQPRVFAYLDRLGAEAGDVQGSGIGLALCRAYVEAMGGEIGLESSPGRGSSFWVQLGGTSAVPVSASDLRTATPSHG